MAWLVYRLKHEVAQCTDIASFYKGTVCETAIIRLHFFALLSPNRSTSDIGVLGYVCIC